MMKPVRLLACAIPFLLAGCGATPMASAPPACSVAQVAAVPLRIENGFVTAPATIDRQQATMLVDTGSERTLVTPGAVDAFNLQPDPRAHTRIIGVGGAVMADHARLQSFGLGGMEMMDQSYAIESLPGSGLTGDEPSGLIGADWLSDYDVDLDVGHGRMTLYDVEGCDGADLPGHLPWQGARFPVPTYRYGRGIMLLKLLVDGTPVTAVLDSGADRSVLSEAAAERAGVGPAALAHDPAGRGGGVDGRIAITHIHVFPSVVIGAEHIANMPLRVGPLRAGGNVEMLLGVDWLRRNRVWIDYRDHMLFIQPEISPG